jgi:hypothetical protein
MSMRNKGSSHTFLLLALMLIVKFTHPVTRMCSVLEARLFYQCLDIILQPLKEAAHIGKMMSNPTGNLCYCFTPLLLYIADIPEACMLACICGKTLPIMMATYKNFGDLHRHPSHTTATTLSQLSSIECDPSDIDQYFSTCEVFQLSGVSHPFWRNWPLTQPPQFLTPEGLHHWHGEFWDHDVRWCVQALGSAELDFRFSVIPSITGLCHVSKGITKLKQVIG